MPVRTRTRSFGNYVGSRTAVSGGAVTTKGVALGSQRTDDVTGNFPNVNAFFSETITAVPGVVSGKTNSFPTYVWNAYPLDSQGPSDAHLTISGIISDAAAITKIAADTNPSRVVVDTPVMLFELGNLPKLLWENGLKTARRAELDRKFGGRVDYRKYDAGKDKPSNSVVASTFGWEQLFRDLFNLLRFSDIVEERIVELENIAKKGGMTRTRRMGTATNSEVNANSLIHQTEWTVTCRTTKTTVSEKWASIRWVPDFGFENRKIRTNGMTQKIRVAVSGWNISPATVWEMLPWSWMVDYFTNIGDLLKASNNSLGYHIENACVMNKITTRVKVGPTVLVTPSGGTFTLPSKSRVTKIRAVGSILTPEVHSPFLSAKQVNNLASIVYNLGASS